MLKLNVNKLFAINQGKICNYTNIFKVIKYKTFKYLFTVFSIVSILISSDINTASAKVQRNTYNSKVGSTLSELDGCIKTIYEYNNMFFDLVFSYGNASSENHPSLAMEFIPSKLDEFIRVLELANTELSKVSYQSCIEAVDNNKRRKELAIPQYDTENQDLDADNKSRMVSHLDYLNNMDNWILDDGEENLLPLDNKYNLSLENISTYGMLEENSDSGVSKEIVQSTKTKQSEENQTSEHIELEKDTQLIQNNSEKVAINTDIYDKKVIEQIKKSVFKATIDQQHKIINIINQLIRNTRLDTSMDIIKTTAITAGDETSNIQSGMWVSSIYGVNNQGLIDNINGYTGIIKGCNIGFDTKIENDIIGIVYSNVHSVLKFKNNRNNDKGIINSYIISIYGQKELPKHLVAQALISVSKNFTKDKITYSLNNAKFKSHLKHRDYAYNLEGLLNYNHFTKNNIIITPNIGLRYGKSLGGIYSEIGSSIQEISLTIKENNILSGILGTKVKIPLKDVLKFNNLGLTMHGSMEHNFNERTQRVNMVIQIFDNKFTQNYAILKQPKTAYNVGTSIVGNIKNTNISLEYNYYLNKYYQSHQGSIKLQINL